MTRREWLLLAPAAAAAAAGQRLRNAALELDLRFAGGRCASRRLVNRLAGDAFELPGDDFALEFENAPAVTAAALSATLGRQTPTRLELLFSGESGLQVRVEYSLPAGKPYLRKQMFVRLQGPPKRLLRADLENWRGVRRDWQSMRADRLPYASHPIHCETLWAGVEFVAAFNEYSREGFVLRSRPGGKTVGREWLPLHSTVIGAAPRGAVRDAFLSYMDDVRLAPPRLVACYNSWWTLPKVIKREDNLALMRELRESLHTRHGVFFDIITTDMGWSDPRSIWKIDRSNLPEAFDDIRAIVKPAGAGLGLWMSPSETYPPVCDYEWAEKSGYAVVKPDKDRTPNRQWGISLACPKYRREVNAQLQALIRENGFDHIKYDGFIAQETVPHDGLLPGPDSVEPLAEYSLELLRSSKEANPRLVTEPTYLNSLATYISPWILKYSDTVWGNSGGDCPLGIGPAPDYRESHTNAREYYIFSSMNEFWLPQNAVHYFDIVHCDPAAGFCNHAAMAYGRGRFFVSTYINPKYMTGEDWRVYAGLLRWSRNNSGILRNTVVVPSRVEVGEPYVYGHWLGMRGILAVRNPSNESKPYTIELGRAGAPRGLRDAVCYSQYPYRKGVATGLSGSSAIPIALAPWELLFLEVVPRAKLGEAVAVGGRWSRDAAGRMAVVPDAALDAVRILQPGGGERVVAVKPRARPGVRGRILRQALQPAPESAWLEVKGKKIPSVAFEMECSLSLSGGRGKALLLVEFPGREREPRPSRCRATVNGSAVVPEESSSGGHVAYLGPNYGAWEAVRPYESQWCWYTCPVDAGESRVVFTGTAAHPQCRIAAWAWLETDLAGMEQSAGAACAEPAMPPYRATIERQGIRLAFV